MHKFISRPQTTWLDRYLYFKIKTTPFQSEDGETRWKDFQNRIIEHNIRVIARSYTRIRTQKMADHLDLDLDQTEKHLSDLVVKGAVWARIGEFLNFPQFQ